MTLDYILCMFPLKVTSKKVYKNKEMKKQKV